MTPGAGIHSPSDFPEIPVEVTIVVCVVLAGLVCHTWAPRIRMAPKKMADSGRDGEPEPGKQQAAPAAVAVELQHATACSAYEPRRADAALAPSSNASTAGGDYDEADTLSRESSRRSDFFDVAASLAGVFQLAGDCESEDEFAAQLVHSGDRASGDEASGDGAQLVHGGDRASGDEEASAGATAGRPAGPVGPAGRAEQRSPTSARQRQHASSGARTSSVVDPAWMILESYHVIGAVSGSWASP